MAFPTKSWWRGILPAAAASREVITLTGADINDIEKRTGESPIIGVEGSNKKQGVTAAMVAGTLVVANTSVTASSRIILTRQETGTHPGAVYVSARTPGTSFAVTSTNAEDTGTVAFLIAEPA